MGNQGRDIVEMDVPELIGLLNKAYASEWLAYYQYWLGAKLAEGLMKDAVASELSKHADDELDHAGELAARIVQLDGTPILTPNEWNDISPCKFAAPTDPDVKALLSQNIEGERCAIRFYKELLATTKDKDPVTHNLILDLLTKEIEHEDDLQRLKEDLSSGKTAAQKRADDMKEKERTTQWDPASADAFVQGHAAARGSRNRAMGIADPSRDAAFSGRTTANHAAGTAQSIADPGDADYQGVVQGVGVRGAAENIAQGLGSTAGPKSSRGNRKSAMKNTSQVKTALDLGPFSNPTAMQVAGGIGIGSILGSRFRRHPLLGGVIGALLGGAGVVGGQQLLRSNDGISSSSYEPKPLGPGSPGTPEFAYAGGVDSGVGVRDQAAMTAEDIIRRQYGIAPGMPQ